MSGLVRYVTIDGKKVVNSSLTTLNIQALTKYGYDKAKYDLYNNAMHQLWSEFYKQGRMVLGFDEKNDKVFGWVAGDRENTYQEIRLFI